MVENAKRQISSRKKQGSQIDVFFDQPILRLVSAWKRSRDLLSRQSVQYMLSLLAWNQVGGKMTIYAKDGFIDFRDGAYRQTGWIGTPFQTHRRYQL